MEKELTMEKADYGKRLIREKLARKRDN